MNRKSIKLVIFLIGFLIIICVSKKKIQTQEEKTDVYKNVLSREDLERYDMGVTYHQLVENPDIYQLKTTVVLSGEIYQIYEVINGIRRIDIMTEEGMIWGYVEDKGGLLEMELEEECVICGQFQGVDDSGDIPLIRILIMEKI